MNLRDLKERLSEIGEEHDLKAVHFVGSYVGHVVTYDVDVVRVHGGADVTLENE